jgi:DNA modification methylase
MTSVDVLITDPPYGVSLGSHLAAKDRRTDRVLVKDGYGSYDDTPENYSQIVVPAIRDALAKSDRGLVFGVPPMIWSLPKPDAMGGIFLPAARGRNKWGFGSLVHVLLYGRAPHLELGAKPTAISSSMTAEKNGHPCPKPLSWMMWATALGAMEGETVFDPFMGSGTTGVACVKQGKQFIGVEIDPQYFDIACERIDAAAKEPDLFINEPKMEQDNLFAKSKVA